MIPRFVTQDGGLADAGGATGPSIGLLRRGQLAAQKGDRLRARRLLRAALMADPANIEARLWLAAIADDPEESVRLLNEVLHEQPGHRQALAGLAWATERLERHRAAMAAGAPPAGPRLQVLPDPPKKRTSAVRLLVAVACLVAVLTGAFAAVSYGWAAAEPPEPAPPLEVAPVSDGNSQMVELPPLYAAPMEGTRELSEAPPTETPLPSEALATPMPVPSPTDTPMPPTTTPTPTPTREPSPTPTDPPTAVPTEVPTETLQLVSDAEEQSEETERLQGKWIEVIIGKQVLIAWEGNRVVRRMIVSTGVARYPTVTGTFRIYRKLRSQTMSGPGYYLPNVPHVMYFYRGYAIHGTYWHSNFGQRMSHGCVNLSRADAAWLFSWAGPTLPDGQWQVWASAKNPGTLVVIHW